MNEIIKARVMAVTEHARILFEGRDADVVQSHASDLTQVSYVTWLRDRESRGSMFYALRIVGSVGAAFEAQEDARATVDAFGDALCAAAALLWRCRLALSPVLTFARELQRDGAETIRGAGALARALTDEVGVPALVHGVALTLAHAIDSCEIVHALTIDPGGLFVAVAGERMGNGVATQHDGSESTPPPIDDAEQRRNPAGMPGPVHAPLRGSEVMGEILDDALAGAAREDERWMRESDGGTKWPVRQVDHKQIVGLGDFIRAGLDAARIEGCVDHHCLCPTCAAPLSYLRDNLYGCGSHEHQAEHLRNLGATEADLDRMRRSSGVSTADVSILS